MFKTLTKEGKILFSVLMIVLIGGTLLWRYQTSKPSSPLPQETKTLPSTKRAYAEDLRLVMDIPTDTNLRDEIAWDGDNIRTRSFYIEKEGYTLHAVYENFHPGTQEDIDKSKSEMKPESIKETTVGGSPAVEGEITGPKARYITVFLMHGKFMSISTLPPTPENKIITDSILSTFSFSEPNH